VLRWLKFTRYLHEFGWLPTIYTPGNPESQAHDPWLSAEIPDSVQVVKRKIIEPYRIFKFITGRKSDEILTGSFVSAKKEGKISKFFIWIRGNFFIPDARKFWIKPSVRFLTRYLKMNPHDIIVSTGPPHSMHMIGFGLKKRLNIPWVADFRDPWTNIDFYRELKLTALADRRHHYLEKKVLTSADAVITIGPALTSEFKAMGCNNVHTITNGYDEPEQIPPYEPDRKFSILHIGSMPQTRNPETLWNVLSDIARMNPEFKSDLAIHLIGNIDYHVIRSIEENGLSRNLVRKPHVPHHEVLSYLLQASVLLLVINNSSNAEGILTNKFFEYLFAGKPIIAIGPVKGDAADILHQTGAGVMLDYNDREETYTYVQNLYRQFKSGTLKINIRNIEQFNRRNLTSSLARLFDGLITMNE